MRYRPGMSFDELDAWLLSDEVRDEEAIRAFLRSIQPLEVWDQYYAHLTTVFEQHRPLIQTRTKIGQPIVFQEKVTPEDLETEEVWEKKWELVLRELDQRYPRRR